MLSAPATARFKFPHPYGGNGGGNVKVKMVGAYTRMPMDTPGAYQLIDNDTGEKYIVWGGADDDAPHSIPTFTSSINYQVPNSTQSPGNFGRLKFQRMRDIVRKSKQRNVIIHPQESSHPEPPNHLKVISAPPNNFQKDSPGHTSSDADRVVVNRGSKPSASSLRGWGSGGSLHYRAKGDEYRPSFDDGANNFFSRKSFQDLGCTHYIIESLRNQHFLRPSHIQAMGFGPIIAGKSCILSDQSGSGKTLAYLLPLIQRLREEELQGLSKSSAQSPRVIVLVPTAELASQVLNTCRSFSNSGVPFRSMVVTGGFRQRTQLENLRQELDILIVTPGRFMFLIKEGYLQLTKLKCAVLDEVDILFNNEDFETAFECLINSSPVTTQYLFVTATLPLDIYNKLVESFPDCKLVTGPGMHRTSPGLEEVLVDCSGDETAEKSPDTTFLNKKNALLQLVEDSPVRKTIVFCNKIDSCRKVENALKRFDRKGFSIKVLPFHAALDQERRLANMEEFRKSKMTNTSLFLVCTDRASRGIDFEGVDHVVLFDYPRDPSEYVRRVGRTARGAGGQGKAFIFAVGKQVSLARRIMERNMKGHPLHDVPSVLI